MGPRKCLASQPAPKVEHRVSEPTLRLQQFLPYKLAVVARAISHELGARYAREFGISIPEWRVIAHLGEVRRCSSGDICVRTEMDKAKVNRAVMRLVASGLVLADVSKSDKRLNVLTLSSKGRATLNGIVPIALGLQDQLEQGLSSNERESLLRIIDKLHNAISTIRDNRRKEAVMAGGRLPPSGRQRKTKVEEAL